jgi:hypothetical protein
VTISRRGAGVDEVSINLLKSLIQSDEQIHPSQVDPARLEQQSAVSPCGLLGEAVCGTAQGLRRPEAAGRPLLLPLAQEEG